VGRFEEITRWRAAEAGMVKVDDLRIAVILTVHDIIWYVILLMDTLLFPDSHSELNCPQVARVISKPFRCQHLLALSVDRQARHGKVFRKI